MQSQTILVPFPNCIRICRLAQYCAQNTPSKCSNACIQHSAGPNSKWSLSLKKYQLASKHYGLFHVQCCIGPSRCSATLRSRSFYSLQMRSDSTLQQPKDGRKSSYQNMCCSSKENTSQTSWRRFSLPFRAPFLSLRPLQSKQFFPPTAFASKTYNSLLSCTKTIRLIPTCAKRSSSSSIR